MSPEQKTSVLRSVCAAIDNGEISSAESLLATQYPFAPVLYETRKYTELEMMRTFVRDGFIDRYSGLQLVFPGTLRLISRLLPNEFPYQRNWKMSQTHIAYWELYPTIDHIVPIARGGSNDESNWITTSMLRNSAKSNWTVEDLNWVIFPQGSLSDWDGLLDFFRNYVQAHGSVLEDPFLLRWHRAAELVLKSGPASMLPR